MVYSFSLPSTRKPHCVASISWARGAKGIMMDTLAYIKTVFSELWAEVLSSATEADARRAFQFHLFLLDSKELYQTACSIHRMEQAYFSFGYPTYGW